jgi:hypothetical protein
LAKFASLCKRTRAHVSQRGDYWGAIARDCGLTHVTTRREAMAAICPWIMRSPPLPCSATILGKTYTCTEIKQWAFVDADKLAIQCSFKPHHTFEPDDHVGGMVVSGTTRPYNQVLRVIDRMGDATEDVEKQPVLWSSGCDLLYALLIEEGFIPEWMHADHESNDIVEIIPLHHRAVAVKLKLTDAPTVHIFILNNDNVAAPTLRHVRSIHMATMDPYIPILTMNQRLWIPLVNGTFQVWGCPDGCELRAHPLERCYALFQLLEDANLTKALRRFEQNRSLIKHHARVSYIGAFMLHTAVRNNATKVVELLLQCGADPNARDEHNTLSPLTRNYLTYSIKPRILTLLVKYGGDPNLTDLVTGECALHKCIDVYMGSMAALRTAVLMVPGIDINAICKVRNETPLETAVRLNKPDAVRFLLKHGGIVRDPKKTLGRHVKPYIRQLLHEATLL